MLNLLAVDDGIVNGNLDFADVLFFVAFVLFAIAAALAVLKKPYEMLLAFIGLACIALAWFVL